jgi:two-component system sensor kinase FixL
VTGPDPDLDRALDALAETIRTLAHDLNQPLAAASNYIAAARQIASAQALSAKPLANALEKTSAQIARAADAVRLMRAALAPGEPQMTGCALHALIEAALASDGRGAALSLAAPDDRIFADPAQIEAALTLLFRAFGGEGLAIATASEAPGVRLELSAERADETAQQSLALAAAARILRAHDGEIATGDKNGRRLVTLRLPLASADGL